MLVDPFSSGNQVASHSKALPSYTIPSVHRTCIVGAVFIGPLIHPTSAGVPSNREHSSWAEVASRSRARPSLQGSSTVRCRVQGSVAGAVYSCLGKLRWAARCREGEGLPLEPPSESSPRSTAKVLIWRKHACRGVKLQDLMLQKGGNLTNGRQPGSNERLSSSFHHRRESSTRRRRR